MLGRNGDDTYRKHVNYDMDDVLEELADVTNYCLQMAQVLGVDIIDVVNKKMDVTEKKIPSR